MSFDVLKKAARRLGVYRQIRWFNRHLLNRKELHQESRDAGFYARFIGRDDIVFDIGANYGQKSRVFLKLGAKVIAFEPQTDCRQELEWRCGKTPSLIVRAEALGSEAGQATFYVRKSRASSGLVQEWESAFESQITVPVCTLDDSIAKYGKPVFIKIDVEGFEYEVLKGLSKPVPYISFEYHVSKRHKGDLAKTCQCIEYLAQLGKVEINMTPAEELVFAFPEWLSKDSFLELFSNLDTQGLRRLFPNVDQPKAHGDIFVRTRVGSSHHI